MKNFGKYFCIAIASVIFMLLLSSQSLAKVKAWEGTITIPTYGWAEDINPKLWALEGSVKFSTTVKGSIVYPYPMQDHLSRTKKDRTYKALFLENEYLKITCLPELGGRLHSVFDKTEGKEMFHLNHVIKPGMIAMRGAFISGGVEWNAGPQVHTVTIVSPVDALVGENADGSAYLEVNNLEKSLRTQWTVRVTLHPGKAYLDERIKIFNPEDSVSPYYFWNCTAFPNRPGTRFIYPMTLGTDHYGVKFFNWPINEGRDMTWLKNYVTSASVFAVNCVYDFFGAYDVDADRGVVQTADHRELGGKKAWTWGTWDFGLVSQQSLTDDDGPYIEVQSGPLPTQSDYGMLAPRQNVSWQEYWYPVHGLGDGFEYATKDIAVQRASEDSTLKLNIIATGRFSGSTCLITRDSRQLLKKTLDLGPENPKVVTLSEAAHSPVEVTITDGKQQVLASFVTPLPIPKTPEPKPSDLMRKPDEQLTLEEKFLKGRKFDLATNRRKAREYYGKVLTEDEQYSSALRSLAVLDIEAGLYEKAAGRLRASVKRDDNDGLSWYFLGISNLKLGDNDEALRCAYKAMRCLDTDSLGCDLAGRAFMRKGEHSKAVKIFRRAVRFNPDDYKAKDHLILALYAAGRKKMAFKQAEGRITQNPTALIPRMISALRGKNRMNRFVRETRSFMGEDEFGMLEASLVFEEMTLIKEAAGLLKAACVDAIPEEKRRPMPLYYLAYFASLLNDQAGAKAYLEQAARLNRDFVFPSRPEEIAVLEYAVENNPGDAHAHLYLGDLYSHLDRQDDAVRQWSKAVELDSTLSVAFRNLGLYAWSAEENLSKAEDLYRKAITARPDDQTLYRDLSDILLADKRRTDAIKLLESMPYEKIRRADIIIILAQMYVDENQYTDAIHLLESTPYFVNWEGQTITWNLFNKAHVERGQQRFRDEDFSGALRDFEAALTYPENIGVGRSNRPPEAMAQYWRGKALFALGRTEDARSAWREGANNHKGSKVQNEHIELCEKALSKSN